MEEDSDIDSKTSRCADNPGRPYLLPSPVAYINSYRIIGTVEFEARKQEEKEYEAPLGGTAMCIATIKCVPLVLRMSHITRKVTETGAVLSLQISGGEWDQWRPPRFQEYSIYLPIYSPPQVTTFLIPVTYSMPEVVSRQFIAPKASWKLFKLCEYRKIHWKLLHMTILGVFSQGSLHITPND